MNIVDTNKKPVATMVWARDEVEDKLIRDSLTALSEQGFNVYATDAGSEQEFIEALENLPNVNVFKPDAKGLLPQIRKSLTEAAESGADFIFYTEPDKKHFFSEKLSDFLARAEVDEDTGIILVGRTKESFNTFPEFQQYTETVINNLCAEVTRAVADYTYGPFLVNRKLISSLESLENNIGWGWRSYLIAEAAKQGYRISQITGDYPCPLEQWDDAKADRIYRMKQLAEHIDGLVLAAKKT
jgi:hypothetical protein